MEYIDKIPSLFSILDNGIYLIMDVIQRNEEVIIIYNVFDTSITIKKKIAKVSFVVTGTGEFDLSREIDTAKIDKVAFLETAELKMVSVEDSRYDVIYYFRSKKVTVNKEFRIFSESNVWFDGLKELYFGLTEIVIMKMKEREVQEKEKE